MLVTTARVVLILLMASVASGQTGEARLSFDVTSIKPADPVLPDGRIVVGMAEPTGGLGQTTPAAFAIP
jgi:hypothetical protein